MHKKILLSAVAVIVVLAVVAGFLFWNSNPERTLNGFLDAVNAKNQEQALSFVSEDIKPGKREEVVWFVEDWTSGDTVTTAVSKDEAWRTRPKMVKDEITGELVEKLDKYGNQKKDFKPTPRHWAHLYQAYATVTFDDIEDPVMIKLRRKTESTWNPVAQLFRGWEVIAITYQPIDEEDFYDFEDVEDFVEEGEEVEGEETVEEGEDVSEDEEAASDEESSEETTNEE